MTNPQRAIRDGIILILLVIALVVLANLKK